MDLQQAQDLCNQAFSAYENKDFDLAISLLSQIERSSDEVKEIYAEAQYNLGIVFKELKRYEEAEQAYKNVKREDSLEQYVRAQNNLGNLLSDLKRFDEAERVYKNVSREDSVEHYARAQVGLGVILYNLKRFAEAEHAYKNVSREDSVEQYALVQVNLGFLLNELKRFAEAEPAFKNVSREDSVEQYARAQFGLGVILYNLKRFAEAEHAYKNVSREDSIEQYALAQVNLGFLLNELKRFAEAEQAFKNVSREDSVEIYAQAQFNLGVLLSAIGRKQEAEKTYKNIKKEDSLEAFERAQKALSDLQYQLSIQVEDSNKSKALLENISQLVKDIRQLLLINFSNSTEKYVAHYTRVETAKFLTNTLINQTKENISQDIKEPKKLREPSYLRLNPIDFMNDPTEGQLLLEALSLNEVEDLDILKLVDHSELKPFIACFTLHHDSLNQFRLYGKTDAIEASGVSLVLEQSFFDSKQENILDDAKTLIERVKNQALNTDDSETHKSKEEVIEVKSQLHLPLYRCIYWDPESSLVEISNVERWAFWRLKKGNHDQEWEKYAVDIKNREKKISDNLDTLKSELKDLFSNNQEDKNKLIEQVLKIILPLRYLVKHFAYREEQECRILHLTQLDNENIIFTPEHKLYLDYRSVLPSLEKIYLAAGALEHKTTFEYLLAQAKKNGKMPIKQDKNGVEKLVKVSRSHNPFRAL